MAKHPCGQEKPQPDIDPRILGIEQSRLRRGILISRLCVSAQIDRRDYWKIRRGEQAPSPLVITSLERALADYDQTEPAAGPLVSALTRMLMAELARYFGRPPAAVLATDFSRKVRPTKEAAFAFRARHLALYLLAVELEIPNGVLARAHGLTCPALQKIRREIEDERDDDGALDRVLNHFAAQLRTARRLAE